MGSFLVTASRRVRPTLQSYPIPCDHDLPSQHRFPQPMSRKASDEARRAANAVSIGYEPPFGDSEFEIFRTRLRSDYPPAIADRAICKLIARDYLARAYRGGPPTPEDRTRKLESHVTAFGLSPERISGSLMFAEFTFLNRINLDDRETREDRERGYYTRFENAESGLDVFTRMVVAANRNAPRPPEAIPARRSPGAVSAATPTTAIDGRPDDPRGQDVLRTPGAAGSWRKRWTVVTVGAAAFTGVSCWFLVQGRLVPELAGDVKAPEPVTGAAGEREPPPPAPEPVTAQQRDSPPPTAEPTAPVPVPEPAENDEGGIAKLKRTLLDSAWHYHDDLFPPGDTAHFYPEGTFHKWRWRYWVVGPRSMRVHFDHNNHDIDTGILFSFNDDLSEFTAEFTDERGRFHRIAGTRR